MNVTWAGIAAIGVLLFTGYTGYRRGFIKEIVSFFFVFLALALAWMLNPYVNTFLIQKTSLYDKIQESCRELPGGQNVAEDDEGDEETEGSLISQLPLPEILQKNLTEPFRLIKRRFIKAPIYLKGVFIKVYDICPLTEQAVL